jgi:5-hydroxyisourate hydrolase
MRVSTHVLDIDLGQPATGVKVELTRDGEVVAEGVTDATGRIVNLAEVRPGRGRYSVGFDVASYFAKQGREAPFLQRVAVDVLFDPTADHYHVPLLLAPFACTMYRGS